MKRKNVASMFECIHYVVFKRSFIRDYCKEDIIGVSSFKAHLDTVLHHRQEQDSLSRSRTFKNMLLQPGLGHIEINMAKGCFKLLWDICLKDLDQMLGYRSPKALAACQAAHDHHKAMQILETGC